jgi:hypothetical protein
LSLNLTYRWTKRLLEAGLLRTEAHKTSGRTLQHYRMIADALRVRVEHVPLEGLLEASLGRHRQMQEVMLKTFMLMNQPHWFFHVMLENNRMVFRTHDGQPNRDDTIESGPPVMSHWFRLQLDLEQANRFSRELQALQDRFKSEERPEDGRALEYSVYFGLVPIAA